MKLLNTLLLLCAALAVAESDAPASCYTTKDDGTVAKTDCSGGGTYTNCKSPRIWVDYVGYDTADATDTAKFACANSVAVTACADAENKCTVCAVGAIADNCNEPKVSTDYKCHKWIYDDDNKAFKKDDTSVCKILTTEKKMCNSPNLEKAAKTTYTSSTGSCGPCDTSQYNDETCQECFGAECNNGSAFLSVSVLLAALSAIVYLV